MQGDKICAYSFKQKKETVFATMTELHSRYAKNAKVSELINAMKKMEPIAGVLIYPESMRKKAQAKIKEYEHVADIKKYSICKAVKEKSKEESNEEIKKEISKAAKTRKAHDEKKGYNGCPISVYNLETGERKEYKSMQNAAAKLAIPFAMLQNSVNKHQPYGVHFAMRKKDEEETVKLLPYYKAKYERELKKCKKNTNIQEKLVWIRVDAKTEILVPKEKATKEYAEWFNLKRTNPKLPAYETWIKTNERRK